MIVLRKAIFSLLFSIILLGILFALWITGIIEQEGLFQLSNDRGVILLSSMFSTIYLTIFFIFNLRHDSAAIVADRLRRLQVSLIEQCQEPGNGIDLGHELKHRREEIKARLKQGIITLTGNNASEIDNLIDTSWEELLSVIEGHYNSDIDEEKLFALLDRILGAVTKRDEPVAEIEEAAIPEEIIEEVEEIKEQADLLEESDELGELEELDELGELEELEPEDKVGDDIIEEASTVSSVIESSDMVSPEEDPDLMELEIVSPFSTLLSNVSIPKENETTNEINETPSCIQDKDNELNLGLPLISKPFCCKARIRIEPLEAFSGNDDENIIPSLENENPNGNGIIEEREGVPYISGDVISSSRGITQPINQDFKNLIDSISVKTPNP